MLTLWLAAVPLAAQAVDVSNSDWNETDASNTSAAPNGWASGTYFNQVEPIGRATMGALKRWWNRINGTVTSTGSSGAYVYSPVNNGYPTAYVTGETYTFIANFTSIGNDTLNINTLGAEPLYKSASSGPVQISSGDIQSGAHVMVQYDAALNGSAGGFYVLAGLNTSLSSVAITSGTIDGVAIGNTTPITAFHLLGSNDDLVDFHNDTIGRSIFFGKSSLGVTVGWAGSGGMVQANQDSLSGSIEPLALNPYGGAVTAPTPGVNDSSTNVATTAFTNPSDAIGSSGFQELPSGIYIEWATFSTSNSGYTTWTFPHQFPNAVWQVTAALNSTNNVVGAALVNLSAATTSGIPVAVVGSSNNYLAGSVMLIAVGH